MRDWKTRIHRLHGHKLKQSDHDVRLQARSFFQSGSILTYCTLSFNFPQTTEKEKLYSCLCCQPSNKGGSGSIFISDTSLRSEETCLWELSCGLSNTHCSCISGEINTSKMSAAAPLPQQIKDWWEQLVLRVHRSGMEEKHPPCYGL